MSMYDDFKYDIMFNDVFGTKKNRNKYLECWAGTLLKCHVCGYEYTDMVECTNYCGKCGAKLEFINEGCKK